MNIWLEISACVQDGPVILLDQRAVQDIPALSAVLSAAENANSSKRTSGLWDYSSRILKEESDKIRSAIEFAKTSEDARSMIFSADVSYRDTCYSLRLFFEKSQ